MNKMQLLEWLSRPSTLEELCSLAGWCRDDQWARYERVPTQSQQHQWVLARIVEEIRFCEDPEAWQWAEDVMHQVIHPPLSLGDLWTVISVKTQIAGSLIHS
jgi:hypothetical protein